jgi:hypothetical protein
MLNHSNANFFIITQHCFARIVMIFKICSICTYNFFTNLNTCLLTIKMILEHNRTFIDFVWFIFAGLYEPIYIPQPKQRTLLPKEIKSKYRLSDRTALGPAEQLGEISARCCRAQRHFTFFFTHTVLHLNFK